METPYLTLTIPDLFETIVCKKRTELTIIVLKKNRNDSK